MRRVKLRNISSNSQTVPSPELYMSAFRAANQPDGPESLSVPIWDSSLWTGPQTVVRHWHLRHPADPLALGRQEREPGGHKLSLRHGAATGSWFLFHNGALALRGRESPLLRTFSIQFTLPDSRLCVIDCVGTSSVVFNHVLRCAGQDIAELRTVLEPSVGEALPRRAGIVDTRTYHDGQKKITVYQLFVEPGGSSGARSLAIERRFSDFVSLDLLVRAATDPHLLASLPLLPSKVYNPLVDQNSDAFISTRKEALQAFLQALLNNGKIAHYADVLSFLGLSPVTGQGDSAHLAALSDGEEGSS